MFFFTYSLSLLSILLLFTFSQSAQTENDLEILKQVHRILQKRDIASNIALDDPKAHCRNGGIWSGGMCHCIHPNTGRLCEHFACVNGISVGFRYEPDSLLFSAPCICDEGYRGELCEFKPVDKCGNRGEWRNNRCDCIGFFFGSECQYTSRCIEGRMKNGRCICNQGFEGEYCDRIVCEYGSPNHHNRSMSCICPKKYKGRHCGECATTGYLVEPYPVCTVSIQKKKTMEAAAELRKKQKKEMRRKLVIIASCVLFLTLIGMIIAVCHTIHKNAITADRERRELMQKERHKLLTNQVRLQKIEMERESAENVTELKESPPRKRRQSEPNIFRLNQDAKTIAASIELLTRVAANRIDGKPDK